MSIRDESGLCGFVNFCNEAKIDGSLRVWLLYSIKTVFYTTQTLEYAMTQLSPNLTPGQQKRRTALKLLSAGAAGVLLPSTAAFAGHSADRANNPLASVLSTQAHSHQFSGAPLTVEVFTGSSMPEDTVLLSSTDARPVTLRQFMPGLLAIDGQTLDLNQALVSGALTISAGTVRSVSLPAMQARSDPAMREYLFAESAAQGIGEGTKIITLHALVDGDGLAVLYIPQVGNAIAIA